MTVSFWALARDAPSGESGAGPRWYFRTSLPPREALEEEDQRFVSFRPSEVGRKMAYAEIYPLGCLAHGKQLEESGLFGAAARIPKSKAHSPGQS